MNVPVDAFERFAIQRMLVYYIGGEFVIFEEEKYENPTYDMCTRIQLLLIGISVYHKNVQTMIITIKKMQTLFSILFGILKSK